jgi:hypothetical protein
VAMFEYEDAKHCQQVEVLNIEEETMTTTTTMCLILSRVHMLPCKHEDRMNMAAAAAVVAVVVVEGRTATHRAMKIANIVHQYLNRMVPMDY